MPRSPNLHRRRLSRGITLIETALATVIIGTAVLGLVRLETAVTTQNGYAQKTTTALLLANNIREVMNGLPMNDPANGIHLGPDNGVTSVTQFNDCEDFANFTANPPIDANRQPIASLGSWQQQVTVRHVSPSNYQLTDSLATDSAVLMDRIQVTVSYQSPGTSTWVPIVTTEWVKAKL